jgi:aspartate racemase
MNAKKKLGIIGGMGARAGSVFLSRIIGYSPALTDQEFPEIILHNNAAIPDRTQAIVYGGPSPVPAICRSLELFNEHGVEIVAMACMTAYHFYDELLPYSEAHLVNPFHLLPGQIRKEWQHAKCIGILATTGALESGIYHRSLRDCNIELVTLAPEEQELLFMRAVYMDNGFKSAKISGEAWELMRSALDRLRRQGVDLIIGGCTEMSIAIDPASVGLPYLDMLDFLARKTAELCYEKLSIKSRSVG